MTPKRPILRYHGGKWMLAPWIISHFPTHRTYVELFGGGGSVLMRKSRSYAEVYNDKWGVVVNVFRVLRDPKTAAELERLIRLTPYSRAEFDDCSDMQIAEIYNPVEQARRTILRSFAGFASAAINAEYSTGFRACSNRSGSTPAHDWANYPDHIHTFTERLQGVCIECRDYQEIIQQQDGPETLFYVDPPYVHSTRDFRKRNKNYAEEMSDDDHRELLKVLNGVDGMVVISGYENDVYNEAICEWSKVCVKTKTEARSERTEVLWLNPRADKMQRQLKLF